MSIIPSNEDMNADGWVGGTQEASNVIVAVRVRPLPSDLGSCVIHKTNDHQIAICKDRKPGAVLESQQSKKYEYTFDAAFGPDANQKEVYEQSTRETIRAVVCSSSNVTVFVYGATGAGKTHTMLGSVEDPGIMPQAIQDVFRTVEKMERDGNVSFGITSSYLEVYNESIQDLLNPEGVCDVKEDPPEVKVRNLTEVAVATEAEALSLLARGTKNRRMEATEANKVSSRSHAVFQLVVTSTREGPDGRPSRRKAKLSMIDLAGSERACATQNRGPRLAEGAHINQSLLALANCINALAIRSAGGRDASRGMGRVKYRDSKLTHLLKNSLEGDCHVVMIANVHPSSKCFDESHNTLKYANRAKNIKVHTASLRPLTEPTPTSRVGELERENRRLKNLLFAARETKAIRSATESAFSSPVSLPEDEPMAALIPPDPIPLEHEGPRPFAPPTRIIQPCEPEDSFRYPSPPELRKRASGRDMDTWESSVENTEVHRGEPMFREPFVSPLKRRRMTPQTETDPAVLAAAVAATTKKLERLEVTMQAMMAAQQEMALSNAQLKAKLDSKEREASNMMASERPLISRHSRPPQAASASFDSKPFVRNSIAGSRLKSSEYSNINRTDENRRPQRQSMKIPATASTRPRPRESLYAIPEHRKKGS